MKRWEFAFAMMALGSSLFFPASAPAAPMAATVVKVSGTAEFVSAADSVTHAAEKGTKLAEGDTVKTGPRSAMVIEFENKNRVQLGESAELTIKQSRMEQDGSFTSVLGLSLGRVRSMVSKFTPGSSKFEYHTKSAVAGVAGTDFVTEVPDPDTTIVAVLPPGMDEDQIPRVPQGTSFCGRPERQGQSKVYVEGTDGAKSTVMLTSCLMTTVSAKRAPAQPAIIPDDMLFNVKKAFLMGMAAPASSLMMEDLANKVSTPLAKPNLNPLLQNLHTPMGGGGGAGGGGTPPSGGVVGGSATITIK